MDGMASLKHSLLQHLEKTHDQNDPLGSFARTALNGEASSREAATFGWHGEEITAAAKKGFAELRQLSPEQRQDIDREAIRYRGSLDDAEAEEIR